MPENGEPKKEHLKVLLNITRRLSSELDFDSLLELILSETTRLIGAERSSLFLYDTEKNELWTKIAEGMGKREIRIPADKNSIAGTVAVTGEPLNIRDAYNCDLFNSDIDRKTGFRTKSVLTVPLVNFREEIVGVVQVLNKKQGQEFNEYDRELLTALGSSAALALERAMLIQESIEKERYEQEMDIARSIQKSLLPEDIPSNRAVSVHGYSEACDETGGDYFDVFEVGDENIAIVVGDISGHGVGAALLMATARAFLKGLLTKEEDYSEVFRQLNDLLETDMEEDRFMTMFMGVVTPEGNLKYVSAGHEPPLIFKTNSSEFMELDSTGIVLGMFPDMEFGLEGPVDLKTGDIGVFFTDGIVEAMNTDDEEFGYGRLQKVIQDSVDDAPEEIINNIVHEVSSFSKGTAQRDDITLVVAKAC